MRCRDARKQLGTHNYVEYNPEDLPEPLRTHLDLCPACRRWMERIRAVSDMVRSMAQPKPSDDFTSRVMGSLPKRSVSPVGNWLSGLFGPLRAPSPLLPATHTIAVACLVLALLVGGGLYAARTGSSVDLDMPGGAIVADGAAPVTAAASVAVGMSHFRPVSASQPDVLGLEDLILRHENYEMNKPLSTDPGIRLVRDVGY